MSWTTAARRVRTWREIAGLSQVELARVLDVSVSTVTRLESGTDEDPPKTQPATLTRLAVEMGEERGRELLTLIGLEDRIEELERETRARRASLSPGDRHSLSYQGAPLAADQERLVLDLIRQMQQREADE